MSDMSKYTATFVGMPILVAESVIGDECFARAAP